jgi:DNA-binding Xre family transcriptional regulator
MIFVWGRGDEIVDILDAIPRSSCSEALPCIRKINMSKLSRMSDVNYNTIRAIWDNEKKDVNVSTLEKIARALKVELSELIEVLPDEEN